MAKQPTKEQLLKNFQTIQDAEDFSQPIEIIPHKKVLTRLLDEVEEIDFREAADLDEDEKLLQRHITVLVIEHLLNLAKEKSWGMCKKNESTYLYNGAYWKKINKEDIAHFLGRAAKKIGVKELYSKFHAFRDELIKQFHAVAHLPSPDTEGHPVMVNLENGTVEINPGGSRLIHIRKPRREDFLTYQLPFKFDPKAKAPRFKKYLDRVLPNEQLQDILSEFIGYIFIGTDQLKLEKTLILHGPGGNGKSVFFDIIFALLGRENMSTFTLESLTESRGYYRAKIADKLVNYGSDISTKMGTALFKQMVSGEPVEARNPYGEAFSIYNYAKFIFNCNELPTDVEHTDAFFRRFLIIPFEETIPEDDQDKELSGKIIANELPGVFNWVMDGLKRVLDQKRLTRSNIIQERNERFQKESDSVQMFISVKNYQENVYNYTTLAELYGMYKSYCHADGYYPVAKRKFSKRLQAAGYKKGRKSVGTVFFITRDKK